MPYSCLSGVRNFLRYIFTILNIYKKIYTCYNISEEKWYFLIDFHLIFLSCFKVFLIVQRDLSKMNHSFNIIFSPHIWQKIVVQLKKKFFYTFLQLARPFMLCSFWAVLKWEKKLVGSLFLAFFLPFSLI